MNDTIEHLEQRDDVKKTEYTHIGDDQYSHVTVEMWHDAEALHALFHKGCDNTISERGLMDVAEERALVVRTTKTDALTKLKSMHGDNLDYEYDVHSDQNS